MGSTCDSHCGRPIPMSCLHAWRKPTRRRNHQETGTKMFKTGTKGKPKPGADMVVCSLANALLQWPWMNRTERACAPNLCYITFNEELLRILMRTAHSRIAACAAIDAIPELKLVQGQDPNRPREDPTKDPNRAREDSSVGNKPLEVPGCFQNHGARTKCWAFLRLRVIRSIMIQPTGT